MAKYSKLIAAVLGNVVAIAFAYFAFKGLQVCTDANADHCTVFGFTQAQVVGVLTLIVNAVAVHQAPANAA